MAKPATSYRRAAVDTATTWLLNSTTVLLNSTTALLNGFFTAIAPNMLNTKNPTNFTQNSKNRTSYAINSNGLVGVTAGDLVVKANSSTVQATGYTTSVPNMWGNKNPTAWSPA